MQENPYKSPAAYPERPRRRYEMSLAKLALLSISVIMTAIVGALALAGK